ncbi:sugar transporter ERD6-like protein 6 [Tanacetum coccineum]
MIRFEIEEENVEKMKVFKLFSWWINGGKFYWRRERREKNLKEVIEEAKMGMTDDFESSLQVLWGLESNITIKVNEIKRSVASGNRRTAIHFSDLKHRKYWFSLMIGIELVVLQQLSGINGVLFYAGNIF